MEFIRKLSLQANKPLQSYALLGELIEPSIDRGASMGGHDIPQCVAAVACGIAHVKDNVGNCVVIEWPELFWQ